MKPKTFEFAVIDILNLMLKGHLTEAIFKYYHTDAWKQKPLPLASYTKGKGGQLTLQRFRTNRCLFVEKVLGVGLGNQTSNMTWLLSGTEGSMLHNTFSVMSVQFWHKGKVVREFYIHTN